MKTIDEIIEHIRSSVPGADLIRELRKDESGRYVRFQWQGREFVIQQNLKVFEVKNNTLFITGASMLLQAVLAATNDRSQALEACANGLRQAEELIVGRRQLNEGLQLLQRVKATIANINRKNLSRPAF